MLIGTSGAGFIRALLQSDTFKLGNTRGKREVDRERKKGELRQGMYA